MTEEADSRDRTPIGISLVCLLLVGYGLFWILTWFLAGMVGNWIVVLLSMVVATSVLILAAFLYTGNRTAWWVSLVFIGGSTLWRISLVADGELDNLVNATVGILLILYLLSKHAFYQPT